MKENHFAFSKQSVDMNSIAELEDENVFMLMRSGMECATIQCYAMLCFALLQGPEDTFRELLASSACLWESMRSGKAG